MSERPDPLLDALGALAREDERNHPAAWTDVLAGRRPAAEVAAEEVGDPEEHAMLASLFTGPITEAEVERVRVRAFGQVGEVAAEARDGSVGDAKRAPDDAKVVALNRGRARWAVAASVLAVAAALALWIGGTTPEPVTYHAAFRSPSVHSERAPGTAGEVARYRPDSAFELVISPSRASAEERALRVRAREAGGEELLLTPPFERSTEGTLRLFGRLDTILPLRPGRWRLEFIITAPEAAPADLAAAAAAAVADRLEVEILAAD